MLTDEAVATVGPGSTTVATLIGADDGAWRRFLVTHPDALPYHHPAWIETLADTYGYEPMAIVVRSAGDIVGGLPLVQLGGKLRSRRWVSLPFTDFCPPLGSDELSQRDLGAACEELRRERGVSGLEIRSPLTGFDAHTSLRGVRHELPLTNLEELSAAFKPQVRRNIRKAEAARLEVRTAERQEDVAQTYFRLHVETRRRLGVPPQPRRFFESLWRRVIEPGLGFALLAYHEGVAVAGAVFLEWNGRLVYKYGASDPRHWSLRPNNLLFWECIRRGCSSGARTLDFGRSDFRDEGLRSFKRSWGASESPLEYTAFGAERSGSGTAARLLQPVVRVGPAWVGRVIGAALYRFAA